MSSFLLLVGVGVVVTMVTGAPTQIEEEEIIEEIAYNSIYPLTVPVKGNGETKYRIAIVADQDKLSKMAGETYKWNSKMKKGWLVLEDVVGEEVKVKRIDWDYEMDFISDISQGGRGMELSELKVFNGKLYTCDERAGMVYELKDGNPSPVPFVRLNDGNGDTMQTFKCEWMTVRDEILWVGSIGMEWLDKDGNILHNNTFWVKKIDARGMVKSENFYYEYDAVRRVLGFEYPGYLTHEAVNWSELKQEWFVLPRKGSSEKFDQVKDESRGINYLIIANENGQVLKEQIGELDPLSGFSSFKFIPGLKDDVFVALKTTEHEKKVMTYIGVYTVKGKVLFGPKLVSDKEKFEGLEFV